MRSEARLERRKGERMKIKDALNIMSIEKAIELNNRRFFCNADETINTIAEWAMKKQIPQKPIKSDREIRYCEVWKCPECGFEWSGRVVDYCYKCGQAIDWSEEGNTRLDLMRECAEVE